MSRRHPGQILPLFAIVLMVLVVVTGLALDGGQALVARREAHRRGRAGRDISQARHPLGGRLKRGCGGAAAAI